MEITPFGKYIVIAKLHNGSESNWKKYPYYDIPSKVKKMKSEVLVATASSIRTITFRSLIVIIS